MLGSFSSDDEREEKVDGVRGRLVRFFLESVYGPSGEGCGTVHYRERGIERDEGLQFFISIE
ncbi:hypothetical protein COLO4_36395 [Corchorus olitorius]|uniref:Uncharacterized protein n=1 Tax=Corchorus olitorius TaxID=93759 RepID=A0A1R3G928_9ROSI|nr:hypothetical protein COLO4_36395 [Corchorus olitorius]